MFSMWVCMCVWPVSPGGLLSVVLVVVTVLSCPQCCMVLNPSPITLLPMPWAGVFSVPKVWPISMAWNQRLSFTGTSSHPSMHLLTSPSLLFTVSLSQWSALWFPLHFLIIYVTLFNRCLTLVRLSDTVTKKYPSVFLSNLCGLQNLGSKIWLRSLHLNIWSFATWGLSIKTKQDVC